MPKIKGLIAASLILSSASSYANVNDHVQKSDNQFYIGADLSMANQVELEVGTASAKESSDLGYNLVAGYEFDTHQVVKTSIEAEYRTFGEIDNTGSFSSDGDAFFINAKTKLFVLYDFGNIYLAPMAGVGKININVKDSANQNHSKKETGYQLGVEIGTRLSQGLDLNLGYRAAFTKIEDINVTLTGFYLGARYFF
ncbi:outer membrane beta-barrel protein [Vibrio tapetis subsp. quintayensis]|uniref:outer membrane beta-barrel protein n=1 Tax=Vibrio tapetis TaxID=52443 RepID=UPI0025B3AEC0|nr:outer membrane beta-barrel protein [Vibrio tapetis]MDN3681799.1 outer membrane beta-barrel protein [Vibrio tapetis subsp. quintayensis]